VSFFRSWTFLAVAELNTKICPREYKFDFKIKIQSMKLRLLFTVGILLTKLNLFAQSWDQVGAPDFSAGNANSIVMAIDNSDNIYVAFKDATLAQKITVMKYDGASWAIVGAAGFSTGVANELSLAINSTGEPYVAYQDMANSDKLGVKKFNGAAWVNVGTPDITFMGISSPCITFDNADVPYVVYRDWMPSSSASVIKFDGTNWVQVGSTSFSAESSQYTRIALDNANVPYVAYGNSTGILKIWKFDGTTWNQVGANITSSGFIVPDIAIYGTTVYITYTDGTNSDKATVKKFNGTNWVAVGSGAISSAGSSSCNMVIDANGIIYVSYIDVDANNYTTTMKYNGIDWSVVGSAGAVYYSPGLITKTVAVNSDNDVFICTTSNEANVYILTCYGDDVVTQNGITLTAQQSGGTYQWLDCNNSYAPVSGATGQNFTPTADGDYAVRIVYGSCVDTSDCMPILGVGVNENEAQIFTVYPNPTNSNLTITTTETIQSINVYSISGKLVQKENKNTFSVENLPAGIYFLQIQTDNGNSTARFVKE